MSDEEKPVCYVGGLRAECAVTDGCRNERCKPRIFNDAIFLWHEEQVWKSSCQEELAAEIADENRHVIYFFANPLDVI